MKALKLIAPALLVSVLLGALTAQAYIGRRTEYRCEGSGKTAISVVSDTERKDNKDNIVGNFKGKEVDFWAKGKRVKDVYVYSDKDSDFEVQIQPAGPYDGGQDSLWGSVSNGGKASNMTCFIGME